MYTFLRQDHERWQQLVGARARRAIRWVRLPTTLPYILVSSYVFRLMASTVHWLLRSNGLRASRRADGTTPSPVPVLDLAFQRTSPLALVQTHVSWLLTRQRRQLYMILSAADDPTALYLLFCGMTRGAAGLYHRLQRKLSSWPLKLFQVTDTRLGQQARLEVAKAFEQAPACCLDFGFGAKLRSYMPGQRVAMLLMQDSWQRRLRSAAMTIDFNTASIECQHALHKRCAVDNTSHEALAASSLIRNVTSTATVDRRKSNIAQPTAASASPRCLKWSGLQHFHAARTRECRTCPFDRAAWDATRSAWLALSDAERTGYGQLSISGSLSGIDVIAPRMTRAEPVVDSLAQTIPPPPFPTDEQTLANEVCV
jgi:hypothetical protein